MIVSDAIIIYTWIIPLKDKKGEMVTELIVNFTNDQCNHSYKVITLKFIQHLMKKN